MVVVRLRLVSWLPAGRFSAADVARVFLFEAVELPGRQLLFPSAEGDVDGSVNVGHHFVEWDVWETLPLDEVVPVVGEQVSPTEVGGSNVAGMGPSPVFAFWVLMVFDVQRPGSVYVDPGRKEVIEVVEISGCDPTGDADEFVGHYRHQLVAEDGWAGGYVRMVGLDCPGADG